MNEENEVLETSVTDNDSSLDIYDFSIIENNTNEILALTQKNNETLISIYDNVSFISNILYYILILFIFYVIVKFFYKLFSWFI